MQRSSAGAIHQAGQPSAAGRGWVAACVFIVIGALLTELAPLVFGNASGAIVDWISLYYVTMKFFVLPAASVIVIATFLVRLLRRGSIPVAGGAATVLALLYLVQLALWPIAWIAWFA